MKQLFTLISLFCLGSLLAQHPFKPQLAPARPANIDVDALQFKLDIDEALPTIDRGLENFRFQPQAPISLPAPTGVSWQRDADNGQIIALTGRPVSLPADAQPTIDDAYAYLAAVSQVLGINDVYSELVISQPQKDKHGNVRVRISQQFDGYRVDPADAWLHAVGGKGFNRFVGRLYPSPKTSLNNPQLDGESAKNLVRESYGEAWIELSAAQRKFISGPQLSVETVLIYPENKSGSLVAVLAQKVESRPNLSTHKTTFFSALTGEMIKEYGHVCSLHHHDFSHFKHKMADEVAMSTSSENADAKTATTVMDGPRTTNVRDLYDELITINTYEQSDSFFLLDASRQMFSTGGGQLSGYLLSLDARGGSPQTNSFNPQAGFSLNNTDWSRTAASVHSNAGLAYEYFRQTFGRNSINGVGGNIFSVYNVNNPDGTALDNAFWNGRALFYGNGNQAFQRLPRGRDVAGHEMAHGVIQATADLVYEEQPGALNESFADVFGYLVEAESGDYRIGEDVVNTQVFTSGTMRDMQNPNNGGSGPGDFRWQPAHMNEYRNLPVNSDNDNGGVHINSGIPNRAFYLFASNPNVGDARAAQVYYKALSEILTRSSRFADLRIAIVMAAQMEYGSTVAAAAEAAFDAVGIGGSAGNYTDDLATNPGERFLLVTNPAQNVLALAREDGTIVTNPLAEVDLISKPSITDNGALAVFIDNQNRLRTFNFGTSQLGFLENNPQTIWRNAVISKDGNRLAVTTTDNDNRILIFDFVSGQGQYFTLTNPTTAGGVSTGDVMMADVMEWEPNGEYLMYDAQSRLNDGITYWDIGFLRAWDNSTANFGDGTINKLFSALPDNLSVGNPTYSKNSPYIIAFEKASSTSQTYTLSAANIETGASTDIYQNGRIGYPSYGIGDDRIFLDAFNTNNEAIIASFPMADDKITLSGNGAVVINGGHWVVPFANGTRNLSSSRDLNYEANNGWTVYPTTFENQLNLSADQPGAVKLKKALLTDISGRTLQSFTLPQSSQHQLDINHLPAGSYFLVLQSETGFSTVKLTRK